MPILVPIIGSYSLIRTNPMYPGVAHVTYIADIPSSLVWFMIISKPSPGPWCDLW